MPRQHETAAQLNRTAHDQSSSTLQQGDDSLAGSGPSLPSDSQSTLDSGLTKKSGSINRRSRFSEQLSPPRTSGGPPDGQIVNKSAVTAQASHNLPEVVAPAPINPETSNVPSAIPLSNIRNRSFQGERSYGLTEVAAPVPDRESRVEHLEDSKQKSNNAHEPTKDQYSGIATQIYIASYLIFFSFLGVLARIGIQWLTFFPGDPVVFSNIWANFAGTLFMGFLSEDQRLFREEWGKDRWDVETARRRLSTNSAKANAKSAHGKVKKTIPLFIGLSTGFCGSLTSFSTFMRDAFFTISNNVATPVNHPQDPGPVTSTRHRNGGYAFEAVLAVIILTVTVNVAALHFGAHIALALERFTPTLPFRLVRKFIDPIFVFLALGCWLAAVIMAILPPDRPGGTTGNTSWSDETWRGQALFALVFAPLGCLLRFALAVKLNSILSWFPLGTFAANVFGTAVLGMSYDLQRASLLSSKILSIGGGRVGCQVLQGVQDGFCGTLTTVSTWILELVTLKRRHAYIYGAVSVLVGLSSIVIIMGSVRWTIGFGDSACDVEIS